MSRPPWFDAACIGLSFVLAATNALADTTRVRLQGSVPAQGEHVTRLTAELRSEGYDVEWSATGGDTPCTGARVVEATGHPGQAWIDVQPDAVSNQLVLSLCYAAPGGAPLRAALRVPADDSRRLAIAAVEALNGLAAKPRPAVTRLTPSPPAAPEKPEPEREPARRAALFVGPGMGVDVGGGRPLVGVTGGLETPLGRLLALELEAFIPLRSTTAQGENRELSLDAAWARFGPRIGWTAAPIRFGLSLQGGAALLWASAETTPPLLGTTEQTASAMFSAGFWLECPATSLLYVRTAGRASRLLPSIELELGDGTTRAFGELLIEMNIGVGLRWDTAR